ncbi:fructose-6-phosphate aldolase [Limisalsivibrio acetivorans]|uniref:fructose-6-phosphate aldolase n=1 Tax=Limisalsivibrio acetivorans TaxID=1304888 RepID=UPI0003B4763D|nr:fructose-6-phosphate aldolase [Limisalsivibrio acetivorans]
MKIFLDTANIDEIREAADIGVIEGVTTNPSLIAKEGRDFKATVKEICEIVHGPVSAEVIALDWEGMVAEGKELAAINEYIVVKVPFTKDGIKATSMLAAEGIDVNVTLVFSPNQALLAAKAGAAFISPFAGRLDDIGHDGIEIVSQCQDVVLNYDYEAEIIAASIRHTEHVRRCAEVGIDVATIPFKVLMQMMKHPLTDIGIDKFLEDWNKANQ